MKPLYTGAEWEIPLLEKIWEEIDVIGKEFGLDYPESSIEIVSFDQMIANCSTHALPSLFNHWTFGLSELQSLENYRKTGSGLAFEVVINTDPAIAYCQENNSTTMQALVMAHAICGHASFFKCNYMFRDFTDSTKILSYMNSYKQYLTECESKYGLVEVEHLLDACFVLQLHAFDTAPRSKVNANDLWDMMVERLQHNEERDREVDLTLPEKDRDMSLADKDHLENLVNNDFYTRQENILQLVCKQSRKLRPWQRRVVEGFCYMSQYFYPQFLTKVINEGWATFWHYQIMKKMHDNGQITDAAWLELIDSHCSVTYQHPYSKQINPYALGFNIFMDIKRMSEDPTEEDKRLFPTVAGGDWLENVKWAMENYNDSSFIMQYLSPVVVKKMGLMRLDFAGERRTQMEYDVMAVGEDRDLHLIREALANTTTMDYMRPRIMAKVEARKQIKTLRLGPMDNVDTGRLAIAILYLWGDHYEFETEEEVMRNVN
jgi:spore cortex formation protein SpoVR/YcgB (stage V sporulation)